jgi:NitT/TauT family transport system permease protein/sulfonate transport system permease protein
MKKWLTVVLVLVLIQILFFVVHSNILLPSPLEIIIALIAQLRQGEIVIDVVMSLERVAIGFLLAALAAIPLGILSGNNKYLNNIVKPFVELLRPIPPIAWIPIAILLFGIGDGSSYFIVFLGAFFPIFTSTYFGAISMPVIYRNVAQSFEIKKSDFIVKILFYFSLPYIFTGLKIGIGMAWMSLIAAELIGAQSGLGYFIQLNRLLLRIDNVVVGMIFIGVIGLMLTKSLTVLEKKITPWITNQKG